MKDMVNQGYGRSVERIGVWGPFKDVESSFTFVLFFCIRHHGTILCISKIFNPCSVQTSI